MNNNGQRELIVTNPLSRTVAIFDKACSLLYTIQFDEAPRSVLVADMNNDGENELIVGTGGRIDNPEDLSPRNLIGVGGDPGGYAYIGKMDENGAFRIDWKSPSYYLRFAKELLTGDFNRNGVNELVLALSWWNRKLIAYEWNGSTYQLVFTDNIGSDCHSLSAAGSRLVVGTGQWSDYGMRVYDNYALVFSDLDDGNTDVSAGDVNGDGSLELLRTWGSKDGGDFPKPRLSVYDSTYSVVFLSDELSQSNGPIALVAAGELIPGGGEEIAVGTWSWVDANPVENIRLFQYNGITYEEVWRADLSTTEEDVYHILIDDLDGDGQNDLYVSTTYGLRVYADHSVGVAAVFGPTGAVPLDSTIVPRALVRSSSRHEETFPVVLRIGIDYEEVKSVTLPPFGSDTVTFALWRANKLGQYAIVCSTMLNGDKYPGDDAWKDSVSVEQNVWICLDSSGPVRFQPGSAYDGARNKVVIFGGRDTWSYWHSFKRETFEWDGVNWVQVSTTGPSARHVPMMTFDEARHQTVLFGGFYPDWNYDDTWIWDGNTWVQLDPSVHPSRRSAVARAYDTRRERVVISGGAHWQTFYDETWEWDGSTWSYRGNIGPSARAFASMAYDEARQVCVLFGGQTHWSGEVLRETWEWDGTNWVIVDTVGPAARAEAFMAYDPARGTVVLYGGRGDCSQPGGVYFDDTWEWDGTSWQRISGLGPSGFGCQFMLYHNQLGRVLMYHVGDTTSLNGSLWVYRGFDHDVGATDIIAPWGQLPLDTTIVPRALVRNHGQYPETFPVLMRVGAVYADTVTVTLQPGQLDTVAFAPWHATQRGTFVVACSTMLDGDEYPRNDKKTGTVTVGTGTGPEIYSITPNRGGDIGFVTVDIRGDGFQRGATAKLLKAGHSPINADTTDTLCSYVLDPSRMIARFSMDRTGQGLWNAVVRNPEGDSAVFFDGFTVEPTRQYFWFDIMGRSELRVGQMGTYWIRLANPGNTDMHQVVIRIRAPERTVCVSVDGNTLIGTRDGRDTLFPIYYWIENLRPGEQLTVPVVLYAPPSMSGCGDTIIYVSNGGDGLSASLLTLPTGLFYEMVSYVHQRAIQQGQNVTEAEVFAHLRQELWRMTGGNLVEWAIWSTLKYLIPGIGWLELGKDIATGTMSFLRACAQLTEMYLYLQVVQSLDPNDKAGPTGFGDAGFVPPYMEFQYIVYFENVDSATAAAQEVIVTDTLPSELDWTSFAFGDFGVSDTHIPVRNPAQSLDVTYRLDDTTEVDMKGTFDPGTGVIRWHLKGRDTRTGELADFLPPNKTPPEGEGWLAFTVDPKPDLVTGTEIRNRAWIVFDVNEPIGTGDWLNTIDAGPPNSRVEALPAEQPLTSFPLRLSGSDDPGGSGIRRYDIYVSENDSAFVLWRSTESTSVTFTGVNGRTYKFYSVARDNVGHVEDTPGSDQAVTTVRLPTGVEVSPNPFVPSRGHEVVSFFGAGLPGAEIRVYNKAGELVRSLTAEQGSDRLDWNAKNEKGRELASGVYIYVATEKTGTVRKGKFAIIR